MILKLILFFITIFIFWTASYEKLKKNLYNISIILNKDKSKEIRSMVKQKGNPLKKKYREIKI